MPLDIYNTLTGRKQRFISLQPGKVKMYVCGITPYDFCHLGHGRAYVTFDVIRRYLEYSGYEVNYIQNITDIDDKIIKRAKNLRKSTKQVADKFTEEYFKDMEALDVRKANLYPKATEHISEMVSLVQGLLAKGDAYTVDGDVYFEIEKFPDYGKLSKRKKKDMLAGARVEIDERKKNPLDFALWKKAKEGEPAWDSPWGKGRPGWHLECSAMSMKYLGETFDIHGGGMDLIFPHHENEIAQSEALTSKPFAKYFIHNGFVTVNKEKMSKSLGNFFTLKEIFAKYEPEVVRFFLLSTHYRSPIDFCDKELEEARKSLERIYLTLDNLESALQKLPAVELRPDVEEFKAELKEFSGEFVKAMDDDFNTAQAISIIFDLVHFANKIIDEKETDRKLLEDVKKLFDNFGGVLGLFRLKKKETLPKEVEKLIKERQIARDKKDFVKADQIRDQLFEMGIILEDKPEGTRWRRR